MTETGLKDHDDDYIVRVRAQVMTRDNKLEAWVPVGGGGMSTVMLRRLVHVDDGGKTYHEYLINGLRLKDKAVVLSCVLCVEFEYTKATPLFHHWKVDEKRFGLTFQSSAHATSFFASVQAARREMLQGLRTGGDLEEDDVGLEMSSARCLSTESVLSSSSTTPSSATTVTSSPRSPSSCAGPASTPSHYSTAPSHSLVGSSTCNSARYDDFHKIYYHPKSRLRMVSLASRNQPQGRPSLLPLQSRQRTAEEEKEEEEDLNLEVLETNEEDRGLERKGKGEEKEEKIVYLEREVEIALPWKKKSKDRWDRGDYDDDLRRGGDDFLPIRGLDDDYEVDDDRALADVASSYVQFELGTGSRIARHEDTRTGIGDESSVMSSGVPECLRNSYSYSTIEERCSSIVARGTPRNNSNMAVTNVGPFSNSHAGCETLVSGCFGRDVGNGGFGRDGESGFGRDGGSGGFGRDGGSGGFGRDGGGGGIGRNGGGGIGRDGGGDFGRDRGFGRDGGRSCFGRDRENGSFARDGSGGFARDGGNGVFGRDASGCFRPAMPRPPSRLHVSTSGRLSPPPPPTPPLPVKAPKKKKVPTATLR